MASVSAATAEKEDGVSACAERDMRRSPCFDVAPRFFAGRSRVKQMMPPNLFSRGSSEKEANANDRREGKEGRARRRPRARDAQAGEKEDENR